MPTKVGSPARSNCTNGPPASPVQAAIPPVNGPVQILEFGMKILDASRCASQADCSTIGTTAFCKIKGFDGSVPVDVDPQPARRDTPIGIELATGRAMAPTRSLKLN